MGSSLPPTPCCHFRVNTCCKWKYCSNGHRGPKVTTQECRADSPDIRGEDAARESCWLPWLSSCFLISHLPCPEFLPALVAGLRSGPQLNDVVTDSDTPETCLCIALVHLQLPSFFDSSLYLCMSSRSRTLTFTGELGSGGTQICDSSGPLRALQP